MNSSWFLSSPQQISYIFVSFVVVYFALIFFTRMAGLRSFSKMSAPDFAMTVAVGSLFGSSISTSTPPLISALFAFACLFAGQRIIAWLRTRSGSFSRVVDNQPVLLMKGSEFLRDNMKSTGVSENDIIGKLREANVISMDEIRAVVFETTGDISVLHCTDQEKQLDDILLKNVSSDV